MIGGVLGQIFVYLAVTAIVAPLAKRIGLGSVLGYLIAGVVIGPFALGLAGEIEDVAQAGEFGVVILLFLIGLEVRPSLLWEMRRAIFGVGAAQLALTGAAISVVALAAGLLWQEALAVGLILAMSSTAIVLQLLEERNLRRGRVGHTAFGVLLFQDLAVIPLLALLPLLGDGAAAGTAAATAAGGHATSLLEGYPVWAKIAAGACAIAAVVVGGRYLTRPVFRGIARAGMREAFTAFALLIVVGSAIVMQAVGLSAALGAFLAGVVLADSEFRREIETDIEPFRGLLLGLFFITVGAGLNLPLVAREPLLIGAMVLGLLVLKAAAMFAVASLFRLDWRSAGTTALALAQGGEFVFVLLGVASAGGVVDGETSGLLTAAVAISMAATPLVVAGWLRLTTSRVAAGPAPVNTFDHDQPRVIVAGYGRFGQIVGRLLGANGFETSTLDVSVEQIALLRRFGRRVYYGDAARLDLLRAAGAERAEVLVIAVDDREKSLEILAAAKETFPHLKILARAFDRRHAYELLNAGAEVVERETFEGGLAMAAETLKALGWRAYRAERAARLFRRHDERLFHSLRALWGDDEKYAVATRESSPRMDDLLRADLERAPEADDADEAWNTDTFYEAPRGP
jgi:monovalent cation:proton antiporter-2 (CPA2) family protein